MRDFSSVGKLVRESREKVGLSQTALAKKLNYKNGQFVSNVERGKCSIPLKTSLLLCSCLNISKDAMALAYVEDYSSTVYSHLYE